MPAKKPEIESVEWVRHRNKTAAGQERDNCKGQIFEKSWRANQLGCLTAPIIVAHRECFEQFNQKIYGRNQLLSADRKFVLKSRHLQAHFGTK
jgi:hypothetical protein